MAETKRKKTPVPTWQSEEAKELVDVLMKQKEKWEAARKAQQFAQVMMVITEVYPPDAQNIMLAYKGREIADKKPIKNKMKEVKTNVQSASTGCTDCGDSVTGAAKNFTELKTLDDVKIYYNTGADETYALGRMKSTLEANRKSVPKSGKLDDVAGAILKLVEGGKFIF